MSLIIPYIVVGILVAGISSNYLCSQGIEVSDKLATQRMIFWPIYLFTRIVKLIMYVAWFLFDALYTVITDWE